MPSGPDKAALVFKALGDPTRLKILREIHTNGQPVCVMMLALAAGVSQSAVSQHLKTLKNAGLVDADRHGYHVHYRLTCQGLEKYGINPESLFLSLGKNGEKEEE